MASVIYNDLNDFQKNAMSWLCKGIHRSPLEFYYEDRKYKIQWDSYATYMDESLIELLIKLYRMTHLNALLKNEILIEKCRINWTRTDEDMLEEVAKHKTNKPTIEWLIRHAALVELAVQDNQFKVRT